MKALTVEQRRVLKAFQGAGGWITLSSIKARRATCLVLERAGLVKLGKEGIWSNYCGKGRITPKGAA